MDDLIPPKTRLYTKPVPFVEAPEFRTALIYYVSDQILARLRNHQTQVTLEVYQLMEDTQSELIGSVNLHMSDAKLVKMKKGSSQKMAQIKQFVLDKGTWLPIGTIGKIKAGLFIVKMPYNNQEAPHNKEIATPLHKPAKTTSPSHPSNHSVDLGLEICSDMSDMSFDMAHDEASEQEDELELEEEEFNEEEYEQEEEDKTEMLIGNGEGQYRFIFRILEAKHIREIMANYSQAEAVFFRYQFGDEEYQCNAEEDLDGWKSIDSHDGIYIQGDFKDIKEWLSDQPPIRVGLFVKEFEQEEELMIGFADVYLKDRDKGVVQQSSIIYDYDKNWYINSKKQFAKLQLQIGILEGWTT